MDLFAAVQLLLDGCFFKAEGLVLPQLPQISAVDYIRPTKCTTNIPSSNGTTRGGHEVHAARYVQPVQLVVEPYMLSLFAFFLAFGRGTGMVAQGGRHKVGWVGLPLVALARDGSSWQEGGWQQLGASLDKG